MKFELTILGCGSATPTLRHQPTSQLLEYEGHYFLIDCGEGTQLQLRKFGIKFQRINHIFISHNHGDHYLGLPGLISTMHLLGRTKPLHIYAQKNLKEATEHQLEISHSRLRFELKWIELNPKSEENIFQNRHLFVKSFPLSHRVPTCGFRFEEKPRLRNIRPEAIAKYNIPIPRIRQIKRGADLKLSDGSTVSNAEITRDPDPVRSYAFCSDTAYRKETAQYVRGVDLLYHESTFLEKESARAKETFHSTASEAAKVASEGGVKKLIVGHYSARYRKLEPFLSQAAEIFPNTILSDEGMKLHIE